MFKLLPLLLLFIMGCNRPSTLTHTVELFIFNYYFVELNPVIFPCVEQIYSKRPDNRMEVELISETEQEQRNSQHSCEYQISELTRIWLYFGLCPVLGHVLHLVPSISV